MNFKYRNNKNKNNKSNPFKTVGYQQTLNNIKKLGDHEDELDETFGFKNYSKGPDRLGLHSIYFHKFTLLTNFFSQ